MPLDLTLTYTPVAPNSQNPEVAVNGTFDTVFANFEEIQELLANGGLPEGGTDGQVLTRTADGYAWETVSAMPAGGTAGQVLTRTADGYAWATVAAGEADTDDELPPGGTTGQVLAKASNTDFAVEWVDPPEGGGGGGGATSALAAAYIKFNGTTTPTLVKVLNVASITRIAQGIYKVAFTTALVDTAVHFHASAGLGVFNDTWSSRVEMTRKSDQGLRTTDVTFTVLNQAGTAYDPEWVEFYIAPFATALPAGAVSTLYDIPLSVAGKPTASELLLRLKAARGFTLPINLEGSTADADVAATASTVFILQRNGVQIGTVTFAPGATVGTFAFAAAIGFAAGDIFKVIAPGTPDSTLSNISMTFAGTR